MTSNSTEGRTPGPYRLWRGTEPESYPEPHDDDRRLVGSNNICMGILFGCIDEVKAAQDYVVLACNSHEALKRQNEELRISLEEMYMVTQLNTELAGYRIALHNAQERARTALTTTSAGE